MFKIALCIPCFVLSAKTVDEANSITICPLSAQVHGPDERLVYTVDRETEGRFSFVASEAGVCAYGMGLPSLISLARHIW